MEDKIIIYLASPYSDPDPHVRVQRYYSAMECTAALLNRGAIVYSPIVHFHELAIRHSLPTDAAWWQRQNEGMLSLVEALYVLAIPDWKTSLGVQAEIKWAFNNGKKLTIVNVKGIPAGEKV